MNIIYMWTADQEGFRKSLTYDIDINVLNVKSKNIGLRNFHEKKNNKKMKPCLTKQLWDIFRLRCDSVRVCHATLQNGRIKVTLIQTQCSKTENKTRKANPAIWLSRYTIFVTEILFVFIFIDQCSENSSLVYLVIQVRVPNSFACHAVFSNDFAPRSPGTMAAEDEEEILKSLRAQSRSVSFVTGSELVNIDLKEDSSHLNEDSELSETVWIFDWFNCCLSSTVCEFHELINIWWVLLSPRSCCWLEYWWMRLDSVEMVTLRPLRKN